MCQEYGYIWGLVTIWGPVSPPSVEPPLVCMYCERRSQQYGDGRVWSAEPVRRLSLSVQTGAPVLALVHTRGRHASLHITQLATRRIWRNALRPVDVGGLRGHVTESL